MLQKAKVYGLPVVFAANKADLRGALTPYANKSQNGSKGRRHYSSYSQRFDKSSAGPAVPVKAAGY